MLLSGVCYLNISLFIFQSMLSITYPKPEKAAANAYSANAQPRCRSHGKVRFQNSLNQVCCGANRKKCLYAHRISSSFLIGIAMGTKCKIVWTAETLLAGSNQRGEFR
jgi:hypothetical protein